MDRELITPGGADGGHLMPARKAIALVAHDNRKGDLLEWARYNRGSLAEHQLFATGTTGRLVAQELPELAVTPLLSGPLGGDQQIGAMIAEGDLDALVFFWDPLEPQPHDPDVKALLRIAVLYNVPTACNRATADFVISSPLMRAEIRAGRPAARPARGRAVAARGLDASEPRSGPSATAPGRREAAANQDREGW